MLRRWFEEAGGTTGSCDRWGGGSAGSDGDEVGDGDSSCVRVIGG
jgi:hypothetical protein